MKTPVEAPDYRGSMRFDRRAWLLAIALVALAAPPRLMDLGRMSFHSDEDLTALASRAVAEGHGLTLPSGLSYRRAAPYTLLVAGSLRLFGADKEWVYRLPGALIGILTIPLLFFVARRWIGPGPAAIAALVLSLSIWHIYLSKVARMYVPFVFAYVLAAYLLWWWAVEGRRGLLVGAICAYVVAISLHPLALFAPQFAVLPHLFAAPVATHPLLTLLVAGGLFLLGNSFHNSVVQPAYEAMGPPPPLEGESGLEGGSGASFVEQFAQFAGPVPYAEYVSIALAVLIAGLVVVRCYPSIPGTDQRWARATLRTLAIGASLVATVAFLAIGQLNGVWIFGSIALLMLEGRWRVCLRKEVLIPVLSGALIGSLWVALRINDEGVIEGLKASLRLPFPYAAQMALEAPGIVALFVLTLLVLSFRSVGSVQVRGLAVASLTTLLAVGVASAWGGTRYVLHAYPFMVIVSAWGMWAGMDWLLSRTGVLVRSRATWVGVALSALVMSGVLVGHGVPQAIGSASTGHGEFKKPYHFRPDHAGPGRFVKQSRLPGDVVIAEDPIQQAWYVGDIDGWFRGAGDARAYLYVLPEGGSRDIYAGSRLLAHPDSVRALVAATEGRVWFITSGETAVMRELYLSEEQRIWLSDLESSLTPAFEGRDGLSRVYCLNCSEN